MYVIEKQLCASSNLLVLSTIFLSVIQCVGDNVIIMQSSKLEVYP